MNINSAQTPSDFGTDISVFPGLDETFTPVSGQRVLGEALAKRLTTERGSLPFHPNYGWNVLVLLNDALSSADVYRAQASIAAECQQDERVASCSCTLTLDPRTSALRFRLLVVTAQGPFRYTLTVDKLNASISLET